MTWATPPSFGVGESPTAAKLNTIRDDLSWLHDSAPGCVLQATAAQTIGNDAWTALAWTDEISDTDGMHSNVTNNTRLTVVTAGVYQISATLPFLSATNSVALGGRVVFNGATPLSTILVPGCSQNGNGATVSAAFAIGAASYIEIHVYQNSGGNLDTVGGATGVIVSMHRTNA